MIEEAATEVAFLIQKYKEEKEMEEIKNVSEQEMQEAEKSGVVDMSAKKTERRGIIPTLLRTRLKSAGRK